MLDRVEPVVRIEAVSHTYRAVTALDDISLQIPSGKMVGVVGPDGVGKSTLLGLIAGARKLQDGTLSVLQADMRKAGERYALGPRIAYMPQGLGKNLYMDLSIEENLDFFGKLFSKKTAERRARIERLTKTTGLFPFLSRPAGKLSGGMKQKLGLCCALIHDPDFLVLDEPTTGVDPLSRQQFWALIESIREMRPHMSVLVSTAYMDEAETFDWLIAMDGGRVLDTGAPDELMAKTGTASLEDAFVKLLPGGDGRNHRKTPVIPPRQADGEEPAIVAKGLTRRFGDFTAVSDVSFEIERGEIFGFLGSNGCGKTTTMKMLTGLLPASEGEAYLFGKPVDANDLETRKRVGFMSQSFSLYGELSVRQNLALHARLFHLDPAKINDRIDALVDRFGLEDHLNATASDLPLGIRQRLSLAVAIIHEPEMLILDEPTSGVDPVARDEFWDILVELSRNEKVTIFLSTHFMTEAMRCDRISLMHAGEVLVYDTPENLAKANGATSLEDSFIAYIAEASKDEPIADVSEPEASTAAMAAEESEQKKRARKHAMRFSLTRLLAYSYREMKEVLRDPVRLAFSFVGSTLLLIVIAYGISYDVEDLTFAAYDLDQTPQSRNYIAQISGSRYFVEAPEVESLRNLEDRMRANDVTMVVEIPPDFGRSLLKGQPTTVSATIDGANTMRAGTIEGYVVGGHVSYLDNLARTNGIDPEGVEFVEIEPRYAFNPSFESIYAIGPGSPAILLLLFPSILMAVSLAREKEIGTITNFYVTPTGRFEYLLGKQLPYIGIGVVNFLILTLVVIVLLQVPLKGSFIGLFIGAVGYVAASTGFGILVSTMTRSQVAAVFATTILAMMPTMQFSGFIQPVSTLEGAGRIMGSLWPTTYYMHLSVGAFTKGLGLPELSLDILALFLFWPAFVIFAACFVNKQEK